MKPSGAWCAWATGADIKSPRDNGLGGCSPSESEPWESEPWESEPWESEPWESEPWESEPGASSWRTSFPDAHHHNGAARCRFRTDESAATGREMMSATNMHHIQTPRVTIPWLYTTRTHPTIVQSH